MAREVLIVNGARTAIGDYGGSLKDIPPTELGARVVAEALACDAADSRDVEGRAFGGECRRRGNRVDRRGVRDPEQSRVRQRVS